MDKLNVSDANTTFVDPETFVPGIGDNILVAYCAILLMALIPIWIGSFKSLKLIHEKHEDREVMTQKDAMMFPVYASGSLFGLYMIFKYLGKEYLNYLVTAYFFVLGSAAVGSTISPLLHAIIPKAFHGPNYHLRLTESPKDAKEEDKEEASQTTEHFSLDFDHVDILALVFGAGFGTWYVLTKHWIANNIFGISFSVSGISLLSVNTFGIGAILLAGLFVYDVFWVFGTDVMVTVAKSFDAPIKVLFPRDFLVNGIHSTNHAMLGLGDIVLPGVLIALLLRFDRSRNPQGHAYFTGTYIAYFIGLVVTIAVMHIFKAAQPALLYLSPACTLTPLALAMIRGETKLLFSYADEPEEEEQKKDQ